MRSARSKNRISVLEALDLLESSSDDELPLEPPFGPKSKPSMKDIPLKSPQRNARRKKSRPFLKTNEKTPRVLRSSGEKCKKEESDELVEEIAKRKADDGILPSGISSPSQLVWYKDSSELKRTYYPCRICPPCEAIHIGLEPLWDPEEVALVQCIEGPNRTKPFKGRRDRLLVERASLIPYHGLNNKNIHSWAIDIWNKYSHQRRIEARQRNQILSKSDVRAGFFYLQRTLKAAQEIERQDCESLGGVSSSSFNSDEFEIPYSQDVPGVQRLQDYSDKKKEPLRPGDVVAYTLPIFRAGDARGRRTATVLATDPDRQPALVLDSGDVLPCDTQVKRIKVMDRGTLINHMGLFRPIEMFRMKRRGDFTAGAAFRKESARLGGIIERNMEELRQTTTAEGFAPLDILHKFKGAKATKIATKTTKTPTSGLLEGGRTRRQLTTKKHAQQQVADVSSDSNESDSDTHHPDRRTFGQSRILKSTKDLSLNDSDSSPIPTPPMEKAEHPSSPAVQHGIEKPANLTEIYSSESSDSSEIDHISLTRNKKRLSSVAGRDMRQSSGSSSPGPDLMPTKAGLWLKRRDSFQGTMPTGISNRNSSKDQRRGSESAVGDESSDDDVDVGKVHSRLEFSLDCKSQKDARASSGSYKNDHGIKTKQVGHASTAQPSPGFCLSKRNVKKPRQEQSEQSPSTHEAEPTKHAQGKHGPGHKDDGKQMKQRVPPAHDANSSGESKSSRPKAAPLIAIVDSSPEPATPPKKTRRPAPNKRRRPCRDSRWESVDTPASTDAKTKRHKDRPRKRVGTSPRHKMTVGARLWTTEAKAKGRNKFNGKQKVYGRRFGQPRSPSGMEIFLPRNPG